MRPNKLISPLPPCRCVGKLCKWLATYVACYFFQALKRLTHNWRSQYACSSKRAAYSNLHRQVCLEYICPFLDINAFNLHRQIDKSIKPVTGQNSQSKSNSFIRTFILYDIIHKEV